MTNPELALATAQGAGQVPGARFLPVQLPSVAKAAGGDF